MRLYKAVISGRILAILCMFLQTVALHAMQPGDTFKQMIEFKDPLTGRLCRRMTTLGKEAGISIQIGGDVAGEHSAWSADSRYVTLTFNQHPEYPTGVYMAEVETGIITYLASTGMHANAAAFNKADPDEVLYFYGYAVDNLDSCWVELRGVNIHSYAVRTIRRWPQVFRTLFLCQSFDGRWVQFVAHSGDPHAQWRDQIMQSVIVNMKTGQEHPEFAFKPGWKFTPRSDRMADGAYWNPVHHNMVFLVKPTTDSSFQRLYYNIDTGTAIPFSQNSSHGSWHPNGLWMAGDCGIFDESNRCVTPECGCWGTPNPHHTRTGHTFADPSGAKLGWDCKWVSEGVGGDYIGEYTFNDIRTKDAAVFRKDPSYAVGRWYGTRDSHAVHPHIHYSPNGRYLVWRSNLRNASGGFPPGPDDGRDNSGDLFIMVLRP